MSCVPGALQRAAHEAPVRRGQSAGGGQDEGGAHAAHQPVASKHLLYTINL